MCRAFLSPWINEKGEEVYTGRFNIGAVTMVLPEIVIKSNYNYDKFIEKLNENMDIAYRTHEYFYEKISKRKASINPLFFTQGGACKTLKPTDTLEKIIDCATASFGYLGLDEAVYLLSGKKLNENIELGKKIMQHMKERIDYYKSISGHLYAYYASPSEGLSDKALRKIEELHGHIEGVTDKEWLTNSHHVDVRVPITALEKMDIESEFWDYPTGGRIMYTEFPHTENLEALKIAINEAMERGFYFGINFENGTCLDCGYQGDFTGINKCPHCHSSNITVVDRVCGLTIKGSH